MRCGVHDERLTNRRCSCSDIVRALRPLVDAVKAWREAECSLRRGLFGHTDSQLCDGDNHQMECAVERARQDVIAAHNKVEQLKAGGS